MKRAPGALICLRAGRAALASFRPLSAPAEGSAHSAGDGVAAAGVILFASRLACAEADRDGAATLSLVLPLHRRRHAFPTCRHRPIPRRRAACAPSPLALALISVQLGRVD
jgi:hypothetical protein